MLMVEGFCYAVPNDYILNKFISFVKKKNISFSVFDYYIITECPIDFNDFKFKISKYYLQRIGRKFDGSYQKVKLKSWNYNIGDFKPEPIKEISKYDFRLKKIGSITRKSGKVEPAYYCLYIKKQRYKLKYNLHMLQYFYKKNETVFFERDYNLIYMEDERIDRDERFSETENEHLNDIDENGIFLPSTRPLKQYQNGFELYDRIFDFSIFYKYYFKNLTENQKKICALLLLGIRVTDIARLLETTQVYITLEIRRLAKKIRKIHNKTQKEFWT